MDRRRGFTLLEALIALLVLSFGLLALAGLHTTLSRHADLARQRSEASQLAEAKLEELRGFVQLASGDGRRAWEDIASGGDAPALASNATFQRDWQASANATWRRIDASVHWADRAGEPNAVRLSTLIARADPSESARLTLSAPGDPLGWTPQRRSLDVPLDALRLGGANRGRSRLAWGGASGGHLVFDDASGVPVALCPVAPTDATDLAQSCTILVAYLLRGYTSGTWADSVTGIIFSASQYLLVAPECVVAAVTDPRDGSTIAGVRSYACLLRPADHDGNPGTPRVWSGRTDIEPVPGGSRIVCRYTMDAATTDNALHPARYVLVSHSLAQQNFLLLDAGPCPPGTTQHQP